MSPSILGVSSSYLQSILGTALQTAGLTGPKASTGTASSQPQPDSGQLSPFAQMLSTLQQLEQSNPAQYQQVTQQIAANLNSAAQTATTEGNTTAAAQLSQLSADFTSASQNGQLPNVQDLAQAIGGGHHHHHHGGGHSPDPSSTSAASSATTANPLNQLLAAFQSNATQSDALNPFSIISTTLASAGIGS